MSVTFLATLAAGMMGILAVCPLELMARRYVRRAGIIALGLETVALAGMWIDRVEGGAGLAAKIVLGVGMAGTLVATALAVRLERRLWVLRAASAAACAASLACALWWGWAAGLWPAGGGPAVWAALVGQSLGAAVLGTVTLAWLLGHAYLTASTMTIEPLRRLSNLFLLAVAARTAFVVAALGLAWAGGGDDAAASLDRLMSQWLVASLRFAVGLGVLALFAWMVRDCVKVRNTQSATGILYFASVVAYAGELSNQYLVQQTGLGF